MSAVTPKAAHHADLPLLASRFVNVAALPWEKTRHPGVETRTLVADPASGLLRAGRARARLSRQRLGQKLGPNPHAPGTRGVRRLIFASPPKPRGVSREW